MPDLIDETPLIHRHRTAMVRHDLSQPVGLLVRHGLLGPGRSLFDYGCGQGDDLRILQASGIAAEGWDPHFRPDAPKTAAEVVNLGFVLNVIERPSERVEALRAAWSLTQRVLSVSTMVVGQGSTAGLKPLGDGVVTTRGTFQKYFTQVELRTLIEQSLGTAPVAVAPGVFFIFRRAEDEQDFLLERRVGRRLSAAAYRIPRPYSPRERTPKPSLKERIPIALANIRELVLRRGRSPHADELSAPALEELARESVSFARALDAFADVGPDAEALEGAAAARREDLVVHYALALLGRSESASSPSAAMSRDIRAHFGSQKEVSIQSMNYLRALADQERVLETARGAEALGLGLVDDRHRFYAMGERSELLPGVLRCYIGCGVVLTGEPAGAYVLRLEPLRRRIVMWPLAQPDTVTPETEYRIQVDLKRQDVFVRPDVRRLVRKGELEGLSPRTLQRKAEADYRQAHPHLENTIFQKLGGTQPPLTPSALTA